MYQNLSNTFIKKALLVLTAMAFGLGLTLLPSDSHALVDSSEPYLVKDINPGSEGSIVGGMENAKLNGTLFFGAEDGVHGIELWKSDGTDSGTMMVKDIRPGGDGSWPNGLTDVNGTIFFRADDGVHGWDLWKSDGTANGTVLVKAINPGGDSYLDDMTDVNGTLFFSADDGVHGRELWKSDGTAAGTVMVKDINPGGDGYPSGLRYFDGTLFFSANDGVHGTELWVSDGTDSGTMMFKDINPGSDGSSPEELTDVNGTLFFGASDGIHGHELWKSDGTAAGTVMVKDIYPGSFVLLNLPNGLIDVNGTLYYTGDDGVHGHELWKSDGTADGTVMVKDINPGGDYAAYLINIINVNGMLFFGANDDWENHGFELWKSDGTAAGTVMVKDINPGTGDSSLGGLTDVNGTLFFSAVDGVHGGELWKSDGMEVGTALVKDINPGAADSNPDNFINVNGTIFFEADDSVHGNELWAIDVQNLQPTISGTQADQHIDDNASIDPFSAVNISDPDDDTLTVIVSLNNANKGELTNLGGFTEGPSGTYTFTGSPASATTAICGLTFVPTENRKTPGSTDTTTFTISADDGYTDLVTDDTTTVIATSINDPPTIAGTMAGQTIDDNDNIPPFTGVNITDPDKDAILIVTVSLDDPDKGVLTNLGVFVESPAGTYTFTGSPTASTTAIQGLIFYPTAGRVPAGQTETTTFTISAEDGYAAPVTDDTTTVIVTAVDEPNIPPSISGTVTGQTVDDNGTIDPFSTVTISDPDTAAITVTVSLDDPAKGDLVNLGGFVGGSLGTYTFTGSPAESTTAIHSLTFDPTEERVPVGQDETTTFTISADDSIAEAVTDDTTTVIVTVVDKTKKVFLPLILR